MPLILDLLDQFRRHVRSGTEDCAQVSGAVFPLHSGGEAEIRELNIKLII